MPELPEVEVTRRSIAARLHGARVTAVRCGKPLRWPLGCAPDALIGSLVGAVTRRGKYLWLPLQPNAASMPAGSGGGLLLHLGMSGSLALLDAVPEPGPHAHFDLHTSRGTLRLTDPRRFGAVLWASAIDAAPAATLLGRLGAEPFDPALTPQLLHAACKRRKTSIKALLLGGQVVVGAGNIYACEALFEARIDPRTAAGRVSRARCARAVTGSVWRAANGCWRRCAARCRVPWNWAARPCAISATATAWPASSSSRPGSMAAPASRAGAAAPRCGASCWRSARPTCARAVSGAAEQSCTKPAAASGFAARLRAARSASMARTMVPGQQAPTDSKKGSMRRR